MKKWLLVILLLLIIPISLVYLMIPKNIAAVASVSMHSTVNGVNGILMHEQQWQRWWPGDTIAHSFTYKGSRFQITKKEFNAIELRLLNKQDSLSGTMAIIPLNNDSVRIDWGYSLPAGNDPIARINTSRKASRFRTQLTEILQQFKQFMEKDENIYGLHIHKQLVTDTLLIATKLSSTHYPSTADVYGLVEQLMQTIHEQNTVVMNVPMLHIAKLDSARYETMVAIPINKMIHVTANQHLKRMVPGNILVAEVKGGPVAITTAFAQVQQYINDHRMTQPAIPFESLITDRRQEPDTTKWVTQIYFPIF